MREFKNYFRRSALRASTAFIGLLFAAGFAATVHAKTQPKQVTIPGITVEARLTPIRVLGLLPSRTVRFELAIIVERRVNTFSEIQYECLFVDSAGTEIGTASRGVASRDAFTAAADGRLVSVTHEELADIGPVNMRCRATRLEK